MSITQPTVAHDPIMRAERAAAIDEVAQQMAAPRPPRIASTSAKSARSRGGARHALPSRVRSLVRRQCL